VNGKLGESVEDLGKRLPGFLVLRGHAGHRKRSKRAFLKVREALYIVNTRFIYSRLYVYSRNGGYTAAFERKR
jgi:hypothetical protein